MQFHNDHILKVKVQQSGDIFINGKLVSWIEFEKALSNLKEIKGAVWFYRQNAIGIQNEIAEQVFTKVLGINSVVSHNNKHCKYL